MNLPEKNEIMLADIQNTQDMCKLLLQSPHYKKMGPDGVYAVVAKAKSTGVSPMEALNGGMYYVQGKVEMTAAMMNQLIRQAGHSITKDKKSDNTICILHGRRVDNGDTWVESFSIEDAKLAGIYRNQWIKYPKDMLFARALTRLARQLFPDVIKGCYVQGEISDAPAFDAPIEVYEEEDKATPNISDEEFEHLQSILNKNNELRFNICKYLKQKFGLDDLRYIPRNLYDLAIKRAEEQAQKEMFNAQVAGEEIQVMEA